MKKPLRILKFVVLPVLALAFVVLVFALVPGEDTSRRLSPEPAVSAMSFEKTADANATPGEEEGEFDSEFWTRVLTSAAAILVAIPVLIFVKPKDRNISRSLKKRLADFNRDFCKHLDSAEKDENFAYSRKTLFNFLSLLNAIQKLSQQAAYENDNVAIDSVKNKVGEARELLVGFKLDKEGDVSEYVGNLESVLIRTQSAETLLDGILDNEKKIRAKRPGKA